jgi:hypothetical protein
VALLFVARERELVLASDEELIRRFDRVFEGILRLGEAARMIALQAASDVACSGLDAVTRKLGALEAEAAERADDYAVLMSVALHRWVADVYQRFDDEVICACELPQLLKGALEERHARFALHDSLRAEHRQSNRPARTSPTGFA